jgi:hypothetical protein
MSLPHNQIVLQAKDGRRISIVQNYQDGSGIAGGIYGKTVEILIGEYECHTHINLEELVKLLRDL